MSRFSRHFAPIYRKIRQDILALCEEFNFRPTHQQRDFLLCVQKETQQPDKKRIAVKSGQGPGKTTAEVLAAVWRGLQDVGAMTIVTAPTMRQLRDVWLAEARRLVKKAKPWVRAFITVTATKVIFANFRDWEIKMITSTTPETAQGLHEANLTIIMDEASGVGRAIVDQYKGTVSNRNSLTIQCGNPNTRDCAFFDCFNKDVELWHTFTWSAEDSPIVDQDNVRLLEQEFGRDSDTFRVRVLGEFPHMDPNCIISSEDLFACTKVPLPLAMAADGGKVIGIDFARYGGDENVVYARSGFAVVKSWSMARVDPSEAVKVALRFKAEMGWKDHEARFVVDAGGIGQGVVHRLYEAGVQVYEFHNGGRSLEPDYYDQITQAWFEFAKLVRARKIRIPEDHTLIRQLSTRQYVMSDRKGKAKLRVEKKEDYIRREGTDEGGSNSPDRAEGIIYSFWQNYTTSARATG